MIRLQILASKAAGQTGESYLLQISSLLRLQTPTAADPTISTCLGTPTASTL